MSKRTGLKVLLLLLAAAIVAAYFLFDVRELVSIESLKARRDDIAVLLDERPFLLAGLFFLFYVTMSSLSIPGVSIVSLAAGATFGLWFGAAIVSLASTTGASVSFLGSRYLARDWVRRRYGRRLDAVDRGLARDGVLYLLMLRLNPAVPYFLINLAMGLTRMRLTTYAAVSWLGMLPATFVYVNAGTQIARIDSPRDVASPQLIGSLVLLSLFPLLAKLLADAIRRRRAYKGWTRPKRFDRNLIVIGAGSGGLVTALIGAAVRAKVTLIEEKEMGGDCLNTGCVPSKALLASAKTAHVLLKAGSDTRLPFRGVMERVHEAIRTIAPHDSEERYTKLGVDVRRGRARIVDPWTVEIDGHDRVTARSIVIAAGAEPFVPPIPGLDTSGYLTSDTMWDALRHRDAPPARLAIIGGGPIGVEMAQAFARLGSRVTLVEGGPRLLPREDEEASTLIADVLQREGVDLRLGHEAVRVESGTLHVEDAPPIPFDTLIAAVGRKARLTGYGLEDLGIETDRTIVLNERLETRYPNIYAVGDVAGPYQFTHFAAHQAWYAAVNALFGPLRRFRADYSVLPWVTFTDPEVAHVGHSEASARSAGVAYEIVRYDLSRLDRAVAEGTNEGFVKLLVVPGKDRILGATIAGAGAGEILAEIVLAMRHGIGLKKILATVHAYPTMAEANKYAAGEWRRAHQPRRLLALVEHWHRWRRG